MFKTMPHAWHNLPCGTDEGTAGISTYLGLRFTKTKY